MSKKLATLLIASSIVLPSAGIMPSAYAAPEEETTNSICDDDSVWITSSKEILQSSPDGKILQRNKIEGLEEKKKVLDIAISKNGDKAYLVTDSSIIIYDIEDKKIVKSIAISNKPEGDANSLSLYGDKGVLLGFSEDKNIYAVDDIEGSGDEIDVAKHLLVEEKGLDFLGYSGDFITYSDGSILAFADETKGDTRFVIFEKDDNEEFKPGKVVGKPVYKGSVVTAYGGTFSNGSLYIATKDGFYKTDKLPSLENNPDDTFDVEKVSELPQNISSFTGATSVQEGNAICSSPSINVTKTAGEVKDNGDGTATATYSVSVKNEGRKEGSVSSLFDNPGFDDNYEILGANWSDNKEDIENADVTNNDSDSTEKENVEKSQEAQPQSVEYTQVDPFAAEDTAVEEEDTTDNNDKQESNSNEKDVTVKEDEELSEDVDTTANGSTSEFMWTPGQEESSREEGGFYLIDSPVSLDPGEENVYNVEITIKPKDYNVEPSKCEEESEKGKGLHNYAGLENEENTSDNTACIDAISVQPYDDGNETIDASENIEYPTISNDNDVEEETSSAKPSPRNTPERAFFPEEKTEKTVERKEEKEEKDPTPAQSARVVNTPTQKSDTPTLPSSRGPSEVQQPFALPASSPSAPIGPKVDTGGNVDNLWVKIKNIFS